MQFVFGSDNNNGYGLLYADNAADAERVRTQLNFPIRADINCCGFLGFGANSNRPLFFKCAKDTGYTREAYYIHGIYRAADEKYYSENIKAFFDDLFVAFTDQQWVSNRRAGASAAPVCAPDTSLYDRFRNKECVINKSTCENIIARILNSENFVLSVPDDKYSQDFARLAMCYIYLRLPTDIIKSCSFIAGIADATNMRIRILPESLANTCTGTVIPICDDNYQPTPVPEFSEIATGLMTLRADESRYKTFIEDYRTICNAFNSNYKPHKFIEFWNAFMLGDINSSKRLLEDYIGDTPNPDPKLIPAFMVSALKGKMPTELKSANVDQLLMPDEILNANSDSLRQLYAVDSEGFVEAIARLYSGNGAYIFESEPVNCARLRVYEDKLSRYKNINRSELAAYQTLFYKVIDEIFAKMKTRIDSCGAVVTKLKATEKEIDAELDKTAAKYFDKQAWDGYYKQIVGIYNNRHGQEAKALNFNIDDVIDRLANDSLTRHNKKFVPKIGDNASAEEIEANREYYEAFMGCVHNNCNVNQFLDSFKNVYNFYSASSPTTKECVKQFIFRCDHFGKDARPAIFNSFSAYKGVDSVIIATAATNLTLALSFAARFRSYDDAVYCTVEILKAFPAAFDRLDKDDFNDCVNVVINNNLSSMRNGSRFSTDAEFKQYINSELGDLKSGNAAKFKKQLLSTWCTEAELAKRNSAKQAKAKKNAGITEYEEDKKGMALPIIIACVGAVLLIAAIILILFLTGVLGGKDEGEDSSDDSSIESSEDASSISGAISDGNSSSADSSSADSSSDDSSTTSDDTTSDDTTSDDSSSDDSSSDDSSSNIPVSKIDPAIIGKWNSTTGDEIFFFRDNGTCKLVSGAQGYEKADFATVDGYLYITNKENGANDQEVKYTIIDGRLILGGQFEYKKEIVDDTEPSDEPDVPNESSTTPDNTTSSDDTTGTSENITDDSTSTSEDMASSDDSTSTSEDASSSADSSTTNENG